MVSSSLDDNARKFLSGDAAAEAIRIISELRRGGFVAYLAGGCVRDALLGKPPKDFDVATDATPESIRELFGRRRTLAFGASFGVIGVLPPKKNTPAGGGGRSIEPTEVATFRSDGFYSDGRRPDSVHYGDAKNDAMRRDFTINGLFYDPLEHRLIDYVGGQQDLQAGILRTIGDPVLRFGEDKLRMLRAVRFATTIGLTIEPSTLEAIIHHADDIVVVSGERVGAEMRRVMAHPNLIDGLEHLRSCRLDRKVLPELQQIDLRLFAERFNRLSQWDFAVALALLVATGEAVDESKSFPAVPTDWIDRWKLSGEEVRKADAALKFAPQLLEADSMPWSQLQPVVIQRDIDTIVALASALAESETGRAGLRRVREALSLPEQQRNPPPLLTGNDLRELGIPAGPEIGRILKELREAQLDQKIESRADAEKLVEERRGES